MIRKEQIFDTGQSLVHFISVWESDRALCGQDLHGDRAMDERGGYDTAKITKKKVNCEECIEIVEHCKSIKRREWI